MESKQHMLEGIARMEAADWAAALGHFERAIELREALPWRGDVESAWVLAAAWINRSDVLRFLGQPENSIHSLDRAIEAMGFVPLAEHPGYANRLLLAWINRATACGDIERTEEALTGFSTAQNLLAEWGESTSPERKLLTSILHANRARVLLNHGRTIDGWHDSQLAVEILDGLEPAPAVAEAAVRARAILCRALALLLDEPRGAELAQDWIARATDATEEALALARASGDRGAWVADLVRYGARIYRICQPHFLGEFIREWTGAGAPLAADQSLRREMANELLLARAGLERRVRRDPHDTEFVARSIRILHTLQLAENELADRKVVAYETAVPASCGIF
jgi:tetratricopeptide (TPR) repeat protein